MDFSVDVIFDGGLVEIKGRRECRRQLMWPSLTYTYRCDPDWGAMPLPDGSALVVGTSLSPRIRSFEELDQAKCPYLPSVIWVDSIDVPTKAEFTYSEVALDDPRSRVSSIKCTVEGISARSEFWFDLTSALDEIFNAFGATSPSFISTEFSDMAKTVPWFQHDLVHTGAVTGEALYSFFLIRSTEESWSQSELLLLITEQNTNVTIIDSEFHITRSDQRKFNDRA